MPEVLYVTSFSPRIYQNCGERMIQSYLDLMKNEPDQMLLVCTEGMELPIEKRHEKIIEYSLEKNKFLKDWLAENIDIIPKEFGGKATPKTQPKVYARMHPGWNYRASRWFRKVVALKYALKKYGHLYDAIVWIDADCYFIKPLSNKFVLGLFQDTGCFYHMGRYRITKKTGIETGFVGFHKDKEGYSLLQEFVNKFKKKRFKKYSRWDDGYVFKMLIDEKKGVFKTNDIAKHSGKLKVMIDSPIYPYVRHDKGINLKNNIMG